MRRRVLLTVWTTALFGLVGCAADDTPDASGADTTALTVVGTDALTFIPDVFAIPAGEEVTVTFTAEAAAEHDFVIADAAALGTTGEEGHGDHGDDETPDTDLHVAHADAGQTVTATFTISEPGTYTVYCSVPGHRESGMLATLTVN
jgi:uncharacterized cupredoxin-like copper-binding protein